MTDLNARATGGSVSVNSYSIRHRSVGELHYRGLSLVATGAANTLYGILTTGDGTPRFDDVVIDAVGEAESSVIGIDFQTDSTTLTNARIKAVNFNTGTDKDAAGVKTNNASDVAFTDVIIYAEAKNNSWGFDLTGSQSRLVRVDARALSSGSGNGLGVRCTGGSTALHDSLFLGESALSTP